MSLESFGNGDDDASCGMTVVVAALVAVLLVASGAGNDGEPDVQPEVTVVVLARNKAHTLPYFLRCLEELKYPKDRISLHIRTDHNEDDTAEILDGWTRKWGRLPAEGGYLRVDYVRDEATGRRYPDEDQEQEGGPGFPREVSRDRFSNVIRLKEEVLRRGGPSGSGGFAWFLDCDVFITDPETLSKMVAAVAASDGAAAVSAPLLESLGEYSNFWAGMGPDHYYRRTDQYPEILGKKTRPNGCVPVPMVHSAVLVNLGDRQLTFDPAGHPDWPYDDMIALALSARQAGIPMHVCCSPEPYGYVMPPLEAGDGGSEDSEGIRRRELDNLSDLKLQIIADRGRFDPLPELASRVERPEKRSARLGPARKVYMINLDRRADRRTKMEACFEELGLEYQRVAAVDGQDIDEAFLEAEGIRTMPEFVEPYHGRAVKAGEIGCFLSHHRVWQEVANHGVPAAVLEDDVRFEPRFKLRMDLLEQELGRLRLDWDLIFLGRKILSRSSEEWVEGSSMLVHVDYSYWTLAYLVTPEGARKLLRGDPLSRILPVDEYLPIMYDKHPNQSWKDHFPARDLKAFSVNPLFVFPTHYVGEAGYVSDTEDSQIVIDEDDYDDLQADEDGSTVHTRSTDEL